MDLLRVFLSSPGDVADERELARRLIEERLRRDPSFYHRAIIQSVSWNDPTSPTPMLAQLTPQEAVGYHLPKPSECDIVVVILWSCMGTPLPSNILKSDGSAYTSGTEWEYEDALKGKPQPDILVYRRTEPPKISLDDPDDPDIRTAIEQRRRVKKFFARFRNPDGSLVGGVTEYDRPSAFIERLENDLRHLIERKLQQRELTSGVHRQGETAIIPDPVWVGSPYPGLHTFMPDQASVFFGRGHEVDELISRLRDPDQRSLIVTGASGSGKSSLIYAGLLPRIAVGAIEGSQRWRVLAFTPGMSGDNPLMSLAREAVSVLPTHVQRTPTELAALLAQTSGPSDEPISLLRVGLPDEVVLILFIDQFEEVFTQASCENRREFLAFVTRAAADPRVRLISTLRADFLSQCATEPSLATILQTGTFVLGAPGPAALTDMIRRPADRAGLALEPALVDMILLDAGNEAGEALPLVAFCLEELYHQTSPEHRFTLGAYQTIGGLRGAIGRRTDSALKSMEEIDGGSIRTALLRIFRSLVHIDAAGKATRQRALRDEFTRESFLVSRLVETLIRERILQAGESGSHPTVTLAHEALMEEWPALKQWLDDNRGWMQRVQRILLNMASPDKEDRNYAIGAVSRLSLAAPDVVAAIVPLLSHPNKDVRQCVAVALGRVDTLAAEATPSLVSALIAALNDAEVQVRRAAAIALISHGPAAVGKIPSLVPTLISALQDTDRYVREEAANALGKLGKQAVGAMPALIAALEDENPSVRVNAISAIGAAGQDSVGIVPVLVSALRDEAEEVRVSAAAALLGMGPIAIDAMPALAASLGDRNKKVRACAAIALVKMGLGVTEVSPRLMPALMDALSDNNTTAFWRESSLLGEIGSAAAEAMPSLVLALTRALKHRDNNIRRSAAIALSKMLPVPDDLLPLLVPGLIEALGDKDRWVRQRAVYVLGEIGSAATHVVQAIIAALNDKNEGVRAAAANALGRIGVSMPGVVPTLISALGDPNPNVQGSATFAIARIGPAAVDALIAALGDGRAGVRTGAAFALGEITSFAIETRPVVEVALAVALDDPQQSVRGSAADALERIRKVPP